MSTEGSCDRALRAGLAGAGDRPVLSASLVYGAWAPARRGSKTRNYSFGGVRGRGRPSAPLRKALGAGNRKRSGRRSASGPATAGAARRRWRRGCPRAAPRAPRRHPRAAPAAEMRASRRPAEKLSCSGTGIASTPGCRRANASTGPGPAARRPRGVVADAHSRSTVASTKRCRRPVTRAEKDRTRPGRELRHRRLAQERAGGRKAHERRQRRLATRHPDRSERALERLDEQDHSRPAGRTGGRRRGRAAVAEIAQGQRCTSTRPGSQARRVTPWTRCAENSSGNRVMTSMRMKSGRSRRASSRGPSRRRPTCRQVDAVDVRGTNGITFSASGAAAGCAIRCAAPCRSGRRRCPASALRG